MTRDIELELVAGDRDRTQLTMVEEYSRIEKLGEGEKEKIWVPPYLEVVCSIDGLEKQIGSGT